MSLLIKKIAEKEGKRRHRKRRNTNHDILVTEKGICRADLACHIESLAIKTHDVRVVGSASLLDESGSGDVTLSISRDDTTDGNNSGRIVDEEVGGCDESVFSRVISSFCCCSSELDGCFINGERDKAIS